MTLRLLPDILFDLDGALLDSLPEITHFAHQVGDTMDDITASSANQMATAFMEHSYRELSGVQVEFRLSCFPHFLASVARENAE